MLRERIGPALGGVVSSRRQLLSRKLLGSLVYINAAAFLRVRGRGKLADQEEALLDPFDDTRVHPECYNTHDWAQRICANALDVQVEDEYLSIVESAMDDSREALAKAIRQTNWNDPRNPPPIDDSVHTLDLDFFAKELDERQGQGQRAKQLEGIKEEIRFPYRDRRVPYAGPTPDELFEWLTGETDATLREGMLVPIRVTGHSNGGVRCRVESGPGLFGFIPMDRVSDNALPVDPITGMVKNLSEVVRRNQLVNAAILKVDKPRFELRLSIRKSDTTSNPEKWDAPLGSVFGQSGWMRPRSLPPLDSTFDAARANGVASSGATRAFDGIRYARSIMHPQFKNCTFKGAEEYLQKISNGPGEAVIRPCSKGPDYLSLTWMWMEGEFKHVDIKESGKIKGKALGTSLKIKDETYEDIDEIFSRYVAPCNDFVAEVTSSPKYHHGTMEEVKAKVREDKAANQKHVPYYICRKGIPGYFSLVWKINSTKWRTVGVSPEGYLLEGRCFQSVAELLKWFKSHAHELGPVQQVNHRVLSSVQVTHDPYPLFFKPLSPSQSKRSQHEGRDQALSRQSALPPPPPQPQQPLLPPQGYGSQPHYGGGWDGQGQYGSQGSYNPGAP
ncbi:unnamed protein product, partial [Discosporangium mesarthrocarpum]